MEMYKGNYTLVALSLKHFHLIKAVNPPSLYMYKGVNFKASSSSCKTYGSVSSLQLTVMAFWFDALRHQQCHNFS
jgi:hypothetical protein